MPTRDPFQNIRLKLKGWKQIFQANGQEKKARVATVISDKIDFKTKVIKGDTEGHFIILKGRIHQEDIKSLASVAQWIEHKPVKQRVASLIMSQGTCLGCGPEQVPSRGNMGGNHTLTFLFLSFSLPSPLSKINK